MSLEYDHSLFIFIYSSSHVLILLVLEVLSHKKNLLCSAWYATVTNTVRLLLSFTSVVLWLGRLTNVISPLSAGRLQNGTLTLVGSCSLLYKLVKRCTGMWHISYTKQAITVGRVSLMCGIKEWEDEEERSGITWLCFWWTLCLTFPTKTPNHQRRKL